MARRSISALIGATIGFAIGRGAAHRLSRMLAIRSRMVEERTGELEARDVMISEAIGQLGRVNAELAQANEAKSEFLGHVSHELRTPLTAMVIAADTLADPEIGPLPDEEVRSIAERIIGDGRYLLALIDDLLDLTRIEAGRLELRPRTGPIAPMLREAADAVGHLAGDKGVEVEVPATDGIEVHADPLRVRQVMTNLLSNALKFTPQGGRVWIEVVPGPDGLTVAVHDTGTGIQPEDHERIFAPFEQAPNAVGGAGLGLAISRRLAEMHGGTLTVRSAPGEGSTFMLSLPPEGSDPAPE